jgi:hypothetical protein
MNEFKFFRSEGIKMDEDELKRLKGTNMMNFFILECPKEDIGYIIPGHGRKNCCLFYRKKMNILEIYALYCSYNANDERNKCIVKEERLFPEERIPEIERIDSGFTRTTIGRTNEYLTRSKLLNFY